MPPLSADPLAELLAAIPTLAGCPATEVHRERFQRYLRVFLRWNQVHRMTALESPLEIVRGLFLDSLLFFNLLPPGPITLLDIGAGGGIPGLPLRLVDDRISLTLIEAKRKRVSFLLAACRELELLDVRILEGRAEELIEQEPALAASFDAVAARAVGGETVITSVGPRYLRPGGTIVIAGSPGSTAGPPFEIVRIRARGAMTRVFLKAIKEGTVPRGT